MKIPKQRLPKSIARQYAESISIALILAVVMRSSFVEAYVIPSGSMEPTILVGDHIFVNKVAYGLRIPRTIAGLPVPGLSSGKYLVHLGAIHHGDIVVFESPRERGLDLIKRVRALGGRIDVAGCEMHLEAQRLRPTYVDEFKYFLDQARKLGLQVQVTEMDVYQGPPGTFQDPYENQKQIFYNIAHACVKDSNCTTFAVWGLADQFSWLRTAKDLTDANPVLFDERYNKKPAYYGVLQALKEGR